MKKKNGFTLIELIAVIVIIGVLAFIAIPTVTKYLFESKTTVYSTFEKTMIDASKNKTLDCISNDGSCELPSGYVSQKIFLSQLIDEGYLDNMKDPDSNQMCDVSSYVTIKEKGKNDYAYEACLICGVYKTDNRICNLVEHDGEKPECGEIIGESIRWTNQNRTISVGCSDKISGCLQDNFTKTFTTTTPGGIGHITIIDNSEETETCNVNAYVDKTLPTCNIDVEGNYLEDYGWYSLRATALLKNEADADSGLLTYGMGISIKNRDYNKNKTFTVEEGITTVLGYVKDIAGNENVCSKEIRVGQGIPEFDLYYGYDIFPDSDYTLSGITKSGSSYTTTNTTPKITINNLSKYIDVEQVRITLTKAIETDTTATIKSGSMTKTGLMQQGSKEIIFIIPKNTYESFEITLGNISGKTYKISRIDALTKNGNTWTNQNIILYVEPADAGIRISEVSYDNGSTWVTDFHRTILTNFSKKVIVRNIYGMQSDPIEYTPRIDKTVPNISLVANKKTANTSVASGTYTNEGLNYIFTKNSEGASGSQIYYCKDTENSCTPNTIVGNDNNLTTYNNDTTDYYIRYRAISLAGSSSEINSYQAKFDTVKPTCSFDSLSFVGVSQQKTLKLTCTDTVSGLVSKTITASDFTLSNNKMTITSVSQNNVTNGIEISIVLQGAIEGESTISFKANNLNDNALNYNDSVSKTISVNGSFKVTLNSQSATSAGTGIIYVQNSGGWYSDVGATNAITTITKPTKDGYSFGGYYTSTNGGGTQIIAANGNINSGNESLFDSDVTIYAKWTECGNGYYCSGGTRTACQAGTYGNGTTTGTTQAQSCQNCGNGAWCTGGTNRSTCPAGTYGNGTTTASTQATACQNCGNGAWCTGGTNRSTCPAGTYGNGTTTASTKAAACKKCEANYYCTGGTAKTACASGKSSVSGSTASSSCFKTENNFSYTGAIQTYTVPATGKYKLEVWGAQGGNGKSGSGGGKGGYSIGYKNLTAGDKLYIGVGGKGGNSTGGYNGGGKGTERAGNATNPGGGGGGATHIALNSNRGILKKYSSYKSEILIVAGGGGGASESGDAGGTGGGSSGKAGTGGKYIGGGGTQSAGGKSGDDDCTASGFGQGGSAPWGSETADTYGVGGGGGGWYGGGASSHSSGGGINNDSGGGGGSGYIGGVTSATTSNGKRSGDGYVTITWDSE